MVKLMLGVCSHKAALYSVKNWHYSKRLPVGKTVRLGVWEDDAFIGCVLFSRGASPHLGTKYGLKQTEVCELVRIALKEHAAPVSKIISIAMKILRKHSTGLKLVVSFADPAQNHVGIIYQASSWLYNGETSAGYEYWDDGRWKHAREVSGGAFGQQCKYDHTKLERRQTLPKHRYLFPFCCEVKGQIESKPYPKAL